jgi:hypothetical protein
MDKVEVLVVSYCSMEVAMVEYSYKEAISITFGGT